MSNIPEENKEIFEILSNAIVKVIDLNNNEVEFKTCEFKYVKNKNSKVYTYTLFLDDMPLIGKKRYYTIYYKCRCGKIQHTLLTKYKNKKQLSCSYCAQKHEYGGIGHNNPNHIFLNTKQTRFNYEYNKESIEFKDDYNKKHLSEIEFYDWLPYIIKINDININNNDKIIYIHHEVCNNQSKYTSKIIINNKKYTLKNISLKCSICGKIFKCHTINLRDKNKNSIKCKDCILVNTRFPIQKYLNTNLTYQSSIEKIFLDLCFKYNIKVLNGIKISYKWNNKEHLYYSDFFLPDYNKIIELKSKHIYYKMQKDNGKLDAKNQAALQYAKNINGEFVFLFDNEIEIFFNKLLN